MTSPRKYCTALELELLERYRELHVAIVRLDATCKLLEEQENLANYRNRLSSDGLLDLDRVPETTSSAYDGAITEKGLKLLAKLVKVRDADPYAVRKGEVIKHLIQELEGQFD